MPASPLFAFLIAWGLVFGAGLFGMWIGPRLPERQRDTDTKTAVAVSMTMVSTLTALVLGLLLSVSNDTFRGNQEQVMSTSSDLIRMDHLFRLYGADAEEARTLLRRYATAMQQDLFPADGHRSNVENEATLDIMAKAEDAAAKLTPETPTQHWLQPRIMETADTIVQEHYALVKQNLDEMPFSLIVLLILWLIVLFAGCGLYTPRHVTSIIVLLVTSGASAGAIFLMLELDTPNSGFVQLSAQPLQYAVEVMERHPDAP